MHQRGLPLGRPEQGDILQVLAVVDAVRQEAGIESVEIYIDVSHDDSTTYLMVVGDRVLLKGHAKAWNFWWETEEELAEEMYSMYCEVTSWQ
jgi:hypothetical protein